MSCQLFSQHICSVVSFMPSHILTESIFQCSRPGCYGFEQVTFFSLPIKAISGKHYAISSITTEISTNLL